MSVLKSKQWFFKAPWGKIAMVSWGEASNPPVIMLHGFMDSAATFIPLVEKFPDTYYYVALDYPGHGLSDPFPTSTTPSQLHIVECLRIVVNRMNWKGFIIIAHSMGCIIGAVYNLVYPQQVSKMVYLDPGPPLSAHSKEIDFSLWFQYIYGSFYDQYSSFNETCLPRTYTHEQAINAVVRARGVSEEQAEILLSRVLIPVGEGKYRLSWDPKMRRIGNVYTSKELFMEILINAPSTLIISATDNVKKSKSKKRQGVERMLQNLQKTCPNNFLLYVEGGHDVHITNPENVVIHIVAFLKRDFRTSLRAKL